MAGACSERAEPGAVYATDPAEPLARQNRKGAPLPERKVCGTQTGPRAPLRTDKRRQRQIRGRAKTGFSRLHDPSGHPGGNRFKLRQRNAPSGSRPGRRNWLLVKDYSGPSGDREPGGRPRNGKKPGWPRGSGGSMRFREFGAGPRSVQKNLGNEGPTGQAGRVHFRRGAIGGHRFSVLGTGQWSLDVRGGIDRGHRESIPTPRCGTTFEGGDSCAAPPADVSGCKRWRPRGIARGGWGEPHRSPGFSRARGRPPFFI